MQLKYISKSTSYGIAMSSVPSPAARQRLLSRRVAYQDLRPCTTAFVDTRTPGSDRKENFTIIGPGVAENPAQHVHIRERHGFNIGGARQPPGCLNSQHSHETAEVFIVHSGRWLFMSGEHGNDGQVELEPGDVISLPTACFRGFENVGDSTGFLFAVLGGDDPGRVLWSPYVFENAKAYGLVLLEDGRLIDTAAGETVPPDGQPMAVTSAADIASLDRLDSAALERCVARRRGFAPVEQSALGTVGVFEAPVIGSAVEDADCAFPAAPLDERPGFQLRHLRFEPGAESARLVRAQPEVLLVQMGTLTVMVDDESLSLAAGDVLTVPVGSARQFQASGSEGCELYVVHGTDQPVTRHLEPRQP